MFALVFLMISTAALTVYAQTDRFEVASIKAVRPLLLKTLDALKKNDLPGAKEAFEAYDAGWNGIEMYINRRDRSRYDELEKNYQDRIEKALNGPNPDLAAITGDVQAMLARYDDTISMVEKAPPLSPLYDDIARLRIVRVDLRPTAPALKAGDLTKARQGFMAFQKDWPKVNDLVKRRSAEQHDGIVKDMEDISAAFKQGQPNVEQLSKLVSDMSLKYNLVIADLNKEAQATK
jgi:hypothetical protein